MNYGSSVKGEEIALPKPGRALYPYRTNFRPVTPSSSSSGPIRRASAFVCAAARSGIRRSSAVPSAFVDCPGGGPGVKAIGEVMADDCHLTLTR